MNVSWLTSLSLGRFSAWHCLCRSYGIKEIAKRCGSDAVKKEIKRDKNRNQNPLQYI